MTQPFDVDKALKALQEGQALTGKDGIPFVNIVCSPYFQTSIGV